MEEKSIDIITALEDRIMNGRWALGSDRVSVVKSELLEILSDLRKILPQELTLADAIYKDSQKKKDQTQYEAAEILKDARDSADEIVEDAKDKAKAIIENARQTQENMVSENNITRIAKEQAEEIIDNAYAEELEVKKSLNEYLKKKLSDVDAILLKTHDEIEKNKNAL